MIMVLLETKEGLIQKEFQAEEEANRFMNMTTSTTTTPTTPTPPPSTGRGRRGRV